MSAGKPLLLHLVFLYHNYWAALSTSLNAFEADLGELHYGRAAEVQTITFAGDVTQLLIVNALKGNAY